MNGIPGIRGVDHIGFTVPNIYEAHEFLVNILGCQFVYSIGPYPAGVEVAKKLDIKPSTVMQEIRFYRLRTGTNLEVFQYFAEDQCLSFPLNSDIGGHHIAIYVDDFDLALNWLRKNNVEVLSEPTYSTGPSRGQKWIYFKAPWGMYFELVSFPDGKAYETDTKEKTKLWDVRRPLE